MEKQTNKQKKTVIAVVREIPSHQCFLGFDYQLNATSGLKLLVLYSALID